jgi:hypothetical protein
VRVHEAGGGCAALDARMQLGPEAP